MAHVRIRVPWRGSKMYGSGFPFPQVILVVGGDEGRRDSQTCQFYLVIFHSAFCPLPEAVSLWFCISSIPRIFNLVNMALTLGIIDIKKIKNSNVLLFLKICVFNILNLY